MNYCKVSGCRFPFSHTTIAHRCGICSAYGHGQIECGKPDMCRALTDDYTYSTNKELADSVQCSISGCPYPFSHMTSAHHCYGCGKRGVNCCWGFTRSARNKTLENIECPSCKAINSVDCDLQIFTGGDCIVCMEPKKMVILKTCKHANVCFDCCSKLAA
jgi:hypothetical protein